MASDYGYITVAQLEGYTGDDYSAIDATLTDTLIESKISSAERKINGYVGTIFTSTTSIKAEFPDIYECTLMMAEIEMNNHMIKNKIGAWAQSQEITISYTDNIDVMVILAKYKDKHDQKQGIWISKYHQTGTIYRPFGWRGY